MTSLPEYAQVRVPDEFRRILLELTVGYLLDQPPDFIDFAIEFFKRKRTERTELNNDIKSKNDILGSDDDESEENIPARYTIRRKSVFAEAYNPEEDDDEGYQPQVHPKTDLQRKNLAEAVKNILLFRSLDSVQTRQVLDAMFKKQVQKGEGIIKQGDDGDNFYVIESGIYDAYVLMDDKTEKLIHTYNNCGSFGELALLYNMPRAATIKAASDGVLWALDRSTFRRIVLKNAFKKRKMYELLIESVPMLSALEPYERMTLADALIPQTYIDGQKIITQGDAADGMYFIEQGSVKISVKDENEQDVEIKQLKHGDYFGELALVTHKPRAASAHAVGFVKIAFLDVEAFERLLGPCMDIMKRNFDDYEAQLHEIFGSSYSAADARS
ncbi:unnamed protein product [Nezara viridula]|uniref:cAMP-dependent protein kinase type II regulatory subunit n=1 Tax=Nezara viridula TaxID=85310 RepID=A0A9P0EDM2_NEZVI|nr:unnamed protein product [Nezara viridula]